MSDIPHVPVPPMRDRRTGPARILAILILLVAAYGIALPVVPLGIRLLAPPVRDFEVTAAARLPDGRLRLMATVEKRHCVFVALRFAWRGDGDEVWRVGYKAADQPPGTDTDRPPGIQSLGPWTIPAPPSDSAKTLHIAVRHRCGPFAVVTPLAILDPPEAPSTPPPP